jgi:hypothetical protein
MIIKINKGNFMKTQQKTFEVMATLNEENQLLLDEKLDIPPHSRVKVILFIPVENDNDIDPDDTPVEEIKASLKRALQEAKAGKRIPLSQMWEGIDAE